MATARSGTRAEARAASALLALLLLGAFAAVWRQRARGDQRYRAAREELAQANRLATLGQITAGIAHEINQPVAAVRAFAENAGTFLSRGLIERAAGNLDQIVQLTIRISTITQGMREFARHRTPEIGLVSLNAAIDGALLLVRHRLQEQGINWSKQIPTDLPPVVADRIRLEQIFVNLLQNSIEALAGRSDGEIRVAACLDVSGVTVQVEDNGPGIPAAIRQHLFTPFATGKPQGLGLGLAIARDIAREFGGELSVTESTSGTCFKLSLRLQ